MILDFDMFLQYLSLLHLQTKRNEGFLYLVLKEVQAFCFGVLIKKSNLEKLFILLLIWLAFIILVVTSICKLFIVKLVTILEFLFIIAIAFDIYAIGL